MSGICGVLHLGGKPASDDDIAGILARLVQRGPEGSAAWRDGPVVLGHTLLATTPEALAETLPLHHSQSGCTITGDIRIDNRAALIAALHLDTAGRVVGDGELVLRAYLAWGTDCLDRLLGDFALAIWDGPRRRLLCARDHAAMRPLVYHHAPGVLFAFASDAKALLAHHAITGDINEERIADFLEDRESFDFTATFFRSLYRLPPAHALAIEDGNLRIWRYWQLEPQPLLSLPSDAAYAEAMREVFTTAVSARLRSAGPVGSMLSGGMDSGSIVAVASQLLKADGAPPLATFSAVSTDPGCIETNTIRVAQTMAHIAPVTISMADFADYREALAQMTRDMGEPFDTMPWNAAVYLAAKRRNIKVVLDGGGGDSVLDSDNMVAWHLRRGNLRQAWREAKGERMFYGPTVSAAGTMLDGLRRIAVPQAMRDLRRMISAGQRQRMADRDSLLCPDFIARINAHARRDEFEKKAWLTLDGRYDDRREMVLHRYILAARERYDRIAAQAGIEARDPFLDRRVLEFSVSLPGDQMRQNGWPKIIMRRAMAGILPDGVRWRVGKEHIGWEFEDALIASGLIDPRPRGLALAARFWRADGGFGPDTREDPRLQVALPDLARYIALWIDHIAQ